MVGVVGTIFIILFVVVIFLLLGYIGYTFLLARRHNQPWTPFPNRRQNRSDYRGPAPAPGGIQGWLNDKFSSLRNKRTADGAYESTSYNSTTRGAGGGRVPGRGFGPLDPDEAWDARVDHETSGYYEEQELGETGPYGGSGYASAGAAARDAHDGMGVGVGGRGRSADRRGEVDARYEEEMHGGSRVNPFGDHAEARELREVSPRPAPGGLAAGKGHKKGNPSLATNGSGGTADYSPTERRSMFREDV